MKRKILICISVLLILIAAIIATVLWMTIKSKLKINENLDYYIFQTLNESADDYVYFIGLEDETTPASLENCLQADLFNERYVLILNSNGGVIAETASAKEQATFDNYFDYLESAVFTTGQTVERLIEEVNRERAVKFMFEKNGEHEYAVIVSVDSSGLLLVNYLPQSKISESFEASQRSFIETVDIFRTVFIIMAVFLTLLFIGHMVILLTISHGTQEQSRKIISGHQKDIEKLTHISNALCEDYATVYYVNTKNDHYIEFSAQSVYLKLRVQQEGDDFWGDVYNNIPKVIYKEDQEMMFEFFRKEKLLEQVENEGVAKIQYRLHVDGEPQYYMCKVLHSKEASDSHLIISVENVNEIVVQDMIMKKNEQFLVAAVKNIYSNIVIVNLTENSYTTMDYEGLSVRFDKYGVYDNLVESQSKMVPKGSQRDEFLSVFSRKNILQSMADNEKTRSLRYRLFGNGDVPRWIDTTAIVMQENETVWMISVSKCADYEQKQIDTLNEALRKANVYRNALMDTTIAYLEVNCSTGYITEGPYKKTNQSELVLIDIPEFNAPILYDDFERFWAEKYIVSDKGRFLIPSSCRYLLKQFNAGHKYVEVDCTTKWFDGSVRELRQAYYISRQENTGDIVAFCTLYDMTEKIARDKEVRDLAKELENSQIQVSTSQMQPHFLYNALGSIREIMLDDPQYASELIYDFTTHLRACIRSMSSNELISLEEELQNTQAYVNIEKMRFQNRLKVEYDIQVKNMKIIPLSIQPLVENAIRHGIYPKGKAGGTVKVSVTENEKSIYIRVDDDGVGFDFNKVVEEITAGKRDSTGLLNLKLRFEKIMQATVEICSEIGMGSNIVICIPKINER